MKKLFLLAGVAMTFAGCASQPSVESTQGAVKERASDRVAQTGSFIPRRKSEVTAGPVSEVDKQALENERQMNNSVRN